MDSVYTCVCGNQSWHIHSDYLECAKCFKHYQIELVEDPSDFNKRVIREIKK